MRNLDFKKNCVTIITFISHPQDKGGGSYIFHEVL